MLSCVSKSLPAQSVAGLLAAVLLSGCASMPLTSMVKLVRTDFVTIDPAVLRVAVKAPHSIRPRRDGVHLKVTVATGTDKQVHDFVLADSNDPAELLSLRGEVSPGMAIYAFRLAPDDVRRAVAVREEALAAKRRGVKGSIGIGVSADGCRLGTPPARVLISTYLRTEAAGEFFPLARDVDVLDSVPPDQRDINLPPC